MIRIEPPQSGHGFLSITGFDTIIFPAERDGVGIGADQTTVRDCHTVRVSTEISQHSLGPAEGWFGIDHLFCFAQWGEIRGEGL